MPYICEVLVSAQDWATIPPADNTLEASRSIRSTLVPGKMAGLVYFRDKKTQACHINFLAFGPLNPNVSQTRERLKLFVTQKGDRQELMVRTFGPGWEAHIV